MQTYKKFIKTVEIKNVIVYNFYIGLIGGENMEVTRENKLAELRAKREEAESLEEKNSALGKELSELENEVPVQ